MVLLGWSLLRGFCGFCGVDFTMWVLWGGFYYVGFVGLLGWSLLREVMCVSRPVDTPNTHPCCTCYTPSLATNI